MRIFWAIANNSTYRSYELIFSHSFEYCPTDVWTLLGSVRLIRVFYSTRSHLVPSRLPFLKWTNFYQGDKICAVEKFNWNSTASNSSIILVQGQRADQNWLRQLIWKWKKSLDLFLFLFYFVASNFPVKCQINNEWFKLPHGIWSNHIGTIL